MKNRLMVLSDVDGTLVRGSLVLNHACLLHDNGVIDLGELPDLWRAEPKNEENMKNLAEAYRAQIVGKSARQLKATEFIKEIVQNDQNFYSTLQRLIDFKEQGAEVLLISGSPNFLVRRFARNYGFKVAASDYFTDEKGKFTGDIHGMFNGEAKQKVIESLGLDKYSQVIAFGDTSSDMPLFANADYSVLVDPNSETLEKCGEMIHEIVLV